MTKIIIVFCCFLFLNNLLPFNNNFTIITTKWNEILKVSLSNHIFRKRKVVIVFWWNALHQIFLTRMKVSILLTTIYQLIIFSPYQILDNLWKLQILLLLIFTGMCRQRHFVHLFQNINEKHQWKHQLISNNTRPTLILKTKLTIGSYETMKLWNNETVGYKIKCDEKWIFGKFLPNNGMVYSVGRIALF